jgi:hypothetical protein
LINHVHADYAPPRSWEQFEELCADVFQSAWQDPALVRHGRAGQSQNGVDIVGRNGAVYPIGIQCKKRSIWPASKLKPREIDDEIAEAMKFKPALKAFYILTTAPDDVATLEHVRKLNEQHQKQGKFEVVVLGWAEIVRRATRDPQVANKHFGPAGGGAPRSPLLATWMMSNGKLELSGGDLELSVAELVQDLYDWPDGHIVIRQRESDALLETLRHFEGRDLTTEQRKERVALRTQLQKLKAAEALAVQGVMLMLTDPVVSELILKVWENDAPLAIQGFLNGHLGLGAQENSFGKTYLRLTLPDGDHHSCSTVISEEHVASILAIRQKRIEMFGNALTDTVADLPMEVRAQVAIPRIIRKIFEYRSQERLSSEEIAKKKALNIDKWKIGIA